MQIIRNRKDASYDEWNSQKKEKERKRDEIENGTGKSQEGRGKGKELEGRGICNYRKKSSKDERGRGGDDGSLAASFRILKAWLSHGNRAACASLRRARSGTRSLVHVIDQPRLDVPCK